MKNLMLVFGLVGLITSLIVWVLVLCCGRSDSAGNTLLAKFRSLPMWKQLAILAAFTQAFVYGSTKTNQPTRGLSAPMMFSQQSGEFGFTAEQLSAGFVLARAATNECWDFSMPTNALPIGEWILRGAAEDWREITVGDGAWTVFSDGRVQSSVAEPREVYSPLRTEIGIVPECNWGLLATSNSPSQVWYGSSPSNSLVVTWRNALLGRDVNAPADFQAEFLENGDFIYRYGLSRADGKLSEPEFASNVVVGAWRNGHGEQLASAAVTPELSSVRFVKLSPEDSVVADRDGDGVSTYDEIFTYGTDPDLVDTDGDGLNDAAEIACGLDPLARSLPDADIIARVRASSTNEACLAESIVVTNAISAWKLWDGFAAEFPLQATNVLFERTLAIDRADNWRQYFLSSKPGSGAGWRLEGVRLEWADDAGESGTAVLSPSGDSLHLPLSTNNPAFVTVRLVATAEFVRCPTPVYFLSYDPAIVVNGGADVELNDGSTVSVFTKGSKSEISVAIDRSLRPCSAGLDEDELLLEGVANMESLSGGSLVYAGDEFGGEVEARGAVQYDLPDVGKRKRILVLNPSVRYENTYSYKGDELVYESTNGSYSVVFRYPLNTECLWRNWYCSDDGEIAAELDEDGIHTENSFVVESNAIKKTSRRYRGSVEFPTYTETTLDAAYGNMLRRVSKLGIDDSVISDEQYAYDGKNRLRSVSYLDGTSVTNAYSCCRLMWTRGRDGRTILRSAETGRDRLYYAEEETWLQDVCTNGFKTTQHFFDESGRETNTVVFVGTTPGEAVVYSVVVRDVYGRVVSESTPVGVTVNSYDGCSSRRTSAVTTAGGISKSVDYLFNECGIPSGSSVNGVTSRVDTVYERISGDWWKVERSVVVGTTTNSVSEMRERLTGLCDAVRRHTVQISSDGVATETMVSRDLDSGLETETVYSSVHSPVVSESLHGLELVRISSSETVANGYDALGRIVSETARSGTRASQSPERRTEFGYSASGDLTSMTTYTNSTSGIVESYGYDFCGRRVSVTNALGAVVSYAYDMDDNIISEDGATYPVSRSYDTQGRRTASATTRNGTIFDMTTWTHDPITGNTLRKTYPDGSDVVYTYTADGMPLRTVLPSAGWWECLYDGQRRLSGLASSDGELDLVIRCDEFGGVESVSNGVSSMSYLRAGGIVTNECIAIGTNAFAIGRTIDGFGRIVERSHPSGAMQRIGYDGENRISVISNGEAVAVYSYDESGRYVGCAFTAAGGVSVARIVTRDPFLPDRIVAVSNFVNGVLRSHRNYGYDPVGRIICCNGRSYSYDACGQVVGERDAGLGQDPHGSRTYAYDGIGNFIEAGGGGVTNLYVTDSLNQYTTAGMDAIAYSDDGGLAVFGELELSYDVGGRLHWTSVRFHETRGDWNR